MKLKNLGPGNFGAYDIDGKRLAAFPGEDFECSDRMGRMLLEGHADRFKLVESGADEQPMAQLGAGPPEAEAPDSTSPESRRGRGRRR